MDVMKSSAERMSVNHGFELMSSAEKRLTDEGK
jgi:hypothetical protein